MSAQNQNTPGDWILLGFLLAGVLIGVGIVSLVVSSAMPLPMQFFCGLAIVLPCEFIAAAIAPWFGGTKMWGR